MVLKWPGFNKQASWNSIYTILYPESSVSYENMVMPRDHHRVSSGQHESEAPSKIYWGLLMSEHLSHLLLLFIFFCILDCPSKPQWNDKQEI